MIKHQFIVFIINFMALLILRFIYAGVLGYSTETQQWKRESLFCQNFCKTRVINNILQYEMAEDLKYNNLNIITIKYN